MIPVGTSPFIFSSGLAVSFVYEIFMWSLIVEKETQVGVMLDMFLDQADKSDILLIKV